MLKEALGLIMAFIFAGGLLFLNPGISGALAPTEKCSPCEDSDVPNDHTNCASRDPNDDTNHDWDEDTQDDSSNELSKPVVSMVMVSTMSFVWARTTMAVVVVRVVVVSSGFHSLTLVWTHSASASLQF